MSYKTSAVRNRRAAPQRALSRTQGAPAEAMSHYRSQAVRANRAFELDGAGPEGEERDGRYFDNLWGYSFATLQPSRGSGTSVPPPAAVASGLGNRP